MKAKTSIENRIDLTLTIILTYLLHFLFRETATNTIATQKLLNFHWKFSFTSISSFRHVQRNWKNKSYITWVFFCDNSTRNERSLILMNPTLILFFKDRIQSNSILLWKNILKLNSTPVPLQNSFNLLKTVIRLKSCKSKKNLHDLTGVRNFEQNFR